MKVFPCGREVVLRRSEYQGAITAISIREKSVSYEISYYEKDTYRSNWFRDYEFVTVVGEKQLIGFKGTL
jgi:hypothetical protein